MEFSGEYENTSVAMVLYNDRRNREDVHRVPSEVTDHEDNVSNRLCEMGTDFGDVDDVHTSTRNILGQPETY